MIALSNEKSMFERLQALLLEKGYDFNLEFEDVDNIFYNTRYYYLKKGFVYIGYDNQKELFKITSVLDLEYCKDESEVCIKLANLE